LTLSRNSSVKGGSFVSFEGKTYPNREYLFECLQCSTLNYKVLSPIDQDMLAITETPGLKSQKLVNNSKNNKIFRIDMINNLEGIIWTENETLVFCLNENSDDDFEVISCGLGKQEGFRIEDSITSNRWEKTWFLNTIDGLLYKLSWKEYHDMVEEYEKLRSQPSDELKRSENLNIVQCASKHKLVPVNIHYMMNYALSPHVSSFRLSKRENLLGFTAQANKLIFLTDLGKENPKVYTTVFMAPDDVIKDFNFLDEKKLIVLTENGYLKVFMLKKRVSNLIETIDLFNFLDDESKLNPHL
jgi:hypothetical protein